MEITNCVTQETTNAAVMGLGSNEQEMLNFAIKNGIINLPHLQDQIYKIINIRYGKEIIKSGIHIYQMAKMDVNR